MFLFLKVHVLLDLPHLLCVNDRYASAQNENWFSYEVRIFQIESRTLRSSEILAGGIVFEDFMKVMVLQIEEFL